MSLKPLRTLFPHDGQLALSPGLLALVTVLQFAEGLSGVIRAFDDKLISLMKESVHLRSKRAKASGINPSIIKSAYDPFLSPSVPVLSPVTVTDILWHNRHDDLGDHQS